MSREGGRQARCKTCRYFDAVYDFQGLCKVRSPRIGEDRRGKWPWVPDHEWCGKHRPFFKVVQTPIGAALKAVDEDE